ncbi:MAG: type II toxin-antitoxin system RelE/ParE family toxin [Bacteroidaceae bacterium]|nr:type II toxin-antitoxin system RelE/ParE family toxin [Bacteroidaceae bacterium]
MMKVRWSVDAKAALDEASDFIKREFGEKARFRFRQEVRRVNNLLKTHPNLGVAEPLLADLPIMYRSVVVNRLNKIVYRVVDNYIEIADF